MVSVKRGLVMLTEGIRAHVRGLFTQGRSWRCSADASEAIITAAVDATTHLIARYPVVDLLPKGGRRSSSLRGRRQSERRQTCLHPRSLDQDSGTQARAEKALVPRRPQMAHRM
jgi:hypothetical protein